jgi:predicted alpha-1,2-mannosidase
VKVCLNGDLIIDEWKPKSPSTYFKEVTLDKNKFYDIKIEYFESTGDATLKFGLEVKENFDPTGFYSYITEGTPWHYTWFVPHDVEGLIDLLNGNEETEEKLDTFFENGEKDGSPNFGSNPYYWHGNEPSHHISYLYNHIGKPWKTQKWVREIMEKSYNTTPAGLCGNDDAGQMSAWYIFSAMGFYPVCPCKTEYEIGSPIFDEVTINLDNKYYSGNKFRIITINNSKNNKYIQRAFLNGKPLDKPFISHDDIINGGNLIFIMGSNPNKNWGS